MNDFSRMPELSAQCRAGVREVFRGDDLGVRQHTFTRSDRFGVAHVYDVHLDISNSAVFADVLRYDELSARSIALEGIASTARGLLHVDALLLACIHRIAHHYDTDR